MSIKIKKNKKKVRVNITVDKDLLDKAKKRLDMFGGKLSTLFNSYLNDFVKSVDKKFDDDYRSLGERMKELEERLEKLEKDKT
jgi:tRNA(Phe) wybutosine-synthesizing methylase Tyw3